MQAPVENFSFYGIKTFLRDHNICNLAKKRRLGHAESDNKFVVSALVLLFAAFGPGFRVGGFLGALLSAVVIAVLGYIVESLSEECLAVPGVGFLKAAAVIYWPSLFVPALEASVWALLRRWSSVLLLLFVPPS